MSFIRIPLFGQLKVKNSRHLRRDERHGEVPVWCVGNTCVVWRPRRSAKESNPPTGKA
jgi:hypothetical protein